MLHNVANCNKCQEKNTSHYKIFNPGAGRGIQSHNILRKTKCGKSTISVEYATYGPGNHPLASSCPLKDGITVSVVSEVIARTRETPVACKMCGNTINSPTPTGYLIIGRPRTPGDRLFFYIYYVIYTST